MPTVNPDPLRYPGAANTAGGTSASSGASTEAASAWLQQQPWYRDTLASWGNPAVLSLGQRGYLARTAQSAGLNPDFGINTNGTVEDWSTPMGAKIALAAFGAWAGGTALGAFSGGGGAAPAASGSAASAAPAASGATGYAALGDTVIPASAASQRAAEAAVGSVGGLLSGKSGNVIKALTALASVYGGHKIADAAAGNTPPQLNDLLDLAVQRQRQQVPITQAVDQGTFQMLPTYARQGILPPSFEGAKKILGGG